MAHSSKTVVLDATPLTMTSGGIRRYAVELSRALAREYPGHRFLLASDQPFELPAGPPNLRALAPPSGMLSRRWWSAGLPLALRASAARVFHGTDFAVPYLPLVPSVMTLHDLSPWKNPVWHSGAGRVRSRTPALLGLGLATMVITPSEAIQREAVDRFNLPPSRVAAVPLAASAHFRPTPPAAPPETPYFLYVGVLEPRKNIPLLVEVWRSVAVRHPVRLILAGRRRDDFPELPEFEGLEIAGEVDEADLPRLYSGATAFIYPSHYEGFGLPILEAMQCGCPVVTSSDPAISEITGEAAIRHDTAAPETWAATLESLVSNPELRQSRSRLSIERSRSYSWSRTARATWEVYAEAEERHGG